MSRTVGDLFDAMVNAKDVDDMRAVYAAETRYQINGDVPNPEGVALANMRYVAGYGPVETRSRIMSLISQVTP